MKAFLKIPPVLLPLLFIALFAAIILLKAPLHQVFEYNPDEGIYLAITSLLSKGFHLYTEIWDDNAPLFSVILGYWLNLFGTSVFAARILVLVFSALLLWSFHQILRSELGNLPASVGLILLMLSNMYALLSVSVMIGLPALALAMLSIYFLTRYKKTGLRQDLLFCASLLALSIQTKFFTAFLVPITLLEIIRTHKRDSSVLIPILLWSATLITLYLAITVVFVGFNFGLFIRQVFLPHLNRLDLRGSGILKIITMLPKDYDIVLMAILGVVIAASSKDAKTILPLSWLLFVILILAKHRPIWYHYYLLISIPLCWLAAISVKGMTMTNVFIRRLTAALICLAAVMVPVKYTWSVSSLWGETTSQERSIIELITKHGDRTRWLITDMTMFAFYTNIPLPPELAVFSLKRTQELKADAAKRYFVSLLSRYRPEQLLVGRLFKTLLEDNPEAMNYIENNYDKALETVILRRISWHPEIFTVKIGSKPPLRHYPEQTASSLTKLLRLYRTKNLTMFGISEYKDIPVQLYIRKDILKNG